MKWKECEVLADCVFVFFFSLCSQLIVSVLYSPDGNTDTLSVSGSLSCNVCSLVLTVILFAF